MPGLFGTRAVLQTDIDLLLQIAAFAILLLSLYGRKRKAKRHTGIMIVATLLEFGTFLVIMGPVFLKNAKYFFGTLNAVAASFLFHAFFGAITLTLSFGLIILWAIRGGNIGSCYKRKRLMDATVSTWTASLVFGVIGYTLAYVLPL